MGGFASPCSLSFTSYMNVTPLSSSPTSRVLPNTKCTQTKCFPPREELSIVSHSRSSHRTSPDAVPRTRSIPSSYAIAAIEPSVEIVEAVSCLGGLVSVAGDAEGGLVPSTKTIDSSLLVPSGSKLVSFTRDIISNELKLGGGFSWDPRRLWETSCLWKREHPCSQ